MPKTDRKRPGDIRLIVPADIMDKLRAKADEQERDVRQQALYYIKRGLES